MTALVSPALSRMLESMGARAIQMSVIEIEQ
jgi:hypothetical protein